MTHLIGDEVKCPACETVVVLDALDVADGEAFCGACGEFWDWRPRMNLHRAEHWQPTCDRCKYQEDGRHYCLLHSIQVKNMDIMRCDDFEWGDE